MRLAVIGRAEAGRAETSEGDMRILVIDDDAQFTSHLVAASPGTVDVEIAHDSRAAIERLRLAEPDVVVLDMRMAPLLAPDAGSEGLAILGAIQGGRRGRLPVVVVTESSDADTLAWCRSLGADAVLQKVDGLGQVFEAAVSAVRSAAGRGSGTPAGSV